MANRTFTKQFLPFGITIEAGSEAELNFTKNTRFLMLIYSGSATGNMAAMINVSSTGGIRLNAFDGPDYSGISYDASVPYKMSITNTSGAILVVYFISMKAEYAFPSIQSYSNL